MFESKDLDQGLGSHNWLQNAIRRRADANSRDTGGLWRSDACGTALRRSAQVAPQMEPSTEDDTDIDIEEPQELCKLRSTQIHCLECPKAVGDSSDSPATLVQMRSSKCWLLDIVSN